jgi:hypothetical protein
MESPETSKHLVLREKCLRARLGIARRRVEEAERERIWAIASAHSAGLSIRTIAAATRLSSSRVHQLLHADEAREIPDWLSRLAEPAVGADAQPVGKQTLPPMALQQRLADENEVLGWCIGWLEQLARGETVVVNLRAETEPKTAFVAFDQARVLRVLKRIAADLDELSGRMAPTESHDSTLDKNAVGVKHRRRLAEPEPELSSLSQREQRDILREKMGLPPSYDRRS